MNKKAYIAPASRVIIVYTSRSMLAPLESSWGPRGGTQPIQNADLTADDAWESGFALGARESDDWDDYEDE